MLVAGEERSIAAKWKTISSVTHAQDHFKVPKAWKYTEGVFTQNRGFINAHNAIMQLSMLEILRYTCFLTVKKSNTSVINVTRCLEWQVTELQNVKYFTQINSFEMNLPQEKARIS